MNRKHQAAVLVVVALSLTAVAAILAAPPPPRQQALAAPPAMLFGSPSYNFRSFVATTQAAGTGVQVDLVNSRTVFCAGGLLGRFCALLRLGDRVDFAGRFAASDSDLGSLGWFPVTTLTVEDAGPNPHPGSSGWIFPGCVSAISPSGTGQDVEINVGQVTETAHCSQGGTLGHLCPHLLVGDCAVFEGSFPTPGDDLFQLGHLALKAMTVDGLEPVAEPDPPGPCSDCDGR